MKAAFYTRNGPAAEVLVIGDMPQPELGAGEVLVRVEYSGVNPSDVKARAGRPLAGDHVIPHSDGSGTIEAVGEGVEATRIGERVWIWNAQWKRPDGTCAEFVSLPQAQARTLPGTATLEEGACLGIPGMTAAHAVNMLCAERDARSVLVTGAGNAVGSLVCQMAAQAGISVIGTASQRRAPLAARSGCSVVLDPYSEDLAEEIVRANDCAPVDAIIDMDFSSTAGLLAKGVLQPHGALIGYGSNDMTATAFDFRQALFNCHRLLFFVVYELLDSERRAAEERLMHAVQKGLDIAVGEIVPLDEAARAHELVEGGAIAGNVLIRCSA